MKLVGKVILVVGVSTTLLVSGGTLFAQAAPAGGRTTGAESMMTMAPGSTGMQQMMAHMSATGMQQMMDHMSATAMQRMMGTPPGP